MASPDARNSRPLVVGANGEMGRLIASRLMGSGRAVRGLDLQPEPLEESLFGRYIAADITCPGQSAIDALRETDCLILAVPLAVATSAIPHVLPHLVPGALWVDTVSVKTAIVQRLTDAGTDIELLSLNPLFAPSLGFEQQRVAAVAARPGPRAAEFMSLMESWGAQVVPVTADEHDRAMALVQVATHAALLALGLTLSDHGYDAALGALLATPPHRVCAALLARIASSSPHVYQEIQRDNPYATEVRASLARSVSQLAESVQAPDGAGFEALVRSVRAALGSEIEPLSGECARLFGQLRA